MHQVWNLEPTNFTLQPGLDRSFSKEQTEFKIYITKKKILHSSKVQLVLIYSVHTANFISAVLLLLKERQSDICFFSTTVFSLEA